MAIEALEDRVTPSGSPLTLSVANLNPAGQTSSLFDVVNPAPIAIPPILSLPPGWIGGQPPPSTPGNGIFVADAFYTTATGQTLTVSAQGGLLSGAVDFSGGTPQVTEINSSVSNVGAALTLTSGATLTVDADGSFTYVPAAGFQGDDSFSFTVSDGTNTTTSTADITVTGPQIYLQNASFTTNAGQTLNVDAANGLLNGAVATSGAPLQVTGFSAAGDLPSSWYWDSIQPVGGAYLNAINGAVNPGTIMQVTPGGETGTIGTSLTLPSGSTLTVNADGSLTYVPAAGFTGDDSFSFTVSDGNVTATGECDISVIGLQLNVPNAYYPATTGQTLTVTAGNGLLSSVYDSTGAAVTVTAVNGSSANVGAAITLASGATLTANADGSFTFAPAAGYQGPDTFTFTVGDGANSSTATATINVIAPQLTVPDRVYGSDGQGLTVDASNGLLAWVQDPAGAAVQVTEVNGSAANVGTAITLASGATLTVNADGSFNYVPSASPTNGVAPDLVPAALVGGDSFSFTVSDGTLTGSASATIFGKLVPIVVTEPLVPPTVGLPPPTTPISLPPIIVAPPVATTPITLAPIFAVNPPAIAVQASTLKPAAGKQVTLTATVKGTASEIQWQVQSSQSSTWTNIDGATRLTLSLTADATNNGSRYRVNVNNAAGSADSTPIALTVTFPPTVTTQPADSTALVGTKATFTATASANPAPAVQWQISLNNGKTWANLQNGAGVQGAHADTLTITTKSQQNGAHFRAVFTSSLAGKPSAVSNGAVLTVQTPPPVVTVKPASQTALINAPVVFLANTSGATKVQWQISTDDGQSWTNVRGATSKTLRLRASFSKTGDLFRAVFSNAGGTTATQAATLTVEKK